MPHSLLLLLPKFALVDANRLLSCSAAFVFAIVVPTMQ